MITGNIFLIYATGLTLGLVAGFFMHRSDYCVVGMFRDAFLFGNTFMLKVLFFQIVVTMVLFEIARISGFLPLYPFPLLGFPSLANIAGGFLFGIGMVLAGGCVVGTLYKMGAGSIVSATAFAGLLIGSGIYAEIHPWWSSVSRATTLSRSSITLPQASGLSPTIFIVLAGLVAAFFITRWQKHNLWHRPSAVAGYIQPWKTAIVMSVIALLSYILVGMPLGITTTYAKLAAMIENIFIPDHVSSLTFFHLAPLDVIHPASGAVMRGGPGPWPDTIWAIQFPIIAGIILGSMLSALLLREFSLHARVPASQYVMALGGGILLGVSSRMAPACNVWHLMGGLPIMALQSILFLCGLVPGCWFGSKIISRIILQQTVSAPGNTP
ncbi:MAG: YeeE/YedE family protein [Pseudomonadota bacterium]